MPIDPAGLAQIRARANEPAVRPRPRLRVLRFEASVTGTARTSTVDFTAFGQALERRAEALAALSPRASVNTTGAVISFALGGSTPTSIVAEQLARPGRIELLRLGRCPKFTDEINPEARRAGRFATVEDDEEVPFASPGPEGIASLAGFRAFLSLFTLPPNLRWLHGAVRAAGGLARRGYCAQTAFVLPAPAIRAFRPTLEPTNLDPMLEVTLAPETAGVVQQFLNPTLERDRAPVVLAIDDEVMGPVRWVEPDAGPALLRIVPNSRIGSVSPELVGILWQSGPIPLPYTLRELPLQEP